MHSNTPLLMADHISNGAPALRCDCGTNVLPGDSDHPLTCTCLALQRTSRHDFVTTSWRRIAAWAGVHTTAEPPFRFFPTPSSAPPVPVQAGGPGLLRAAFISGALRELGVALCRGNASLCRSGAYVAKRAARRTTMRGLTRPSAEVV
jgi:hypothetical protein